MPDYSHILDIHRYTLNRCALFALSLCCLLFVMAPVAAQPDTERDRAVQHMRAFLEQPFLEQGGFSQFDCSITSAAQPTQPFTCDASTAEGKQLEYLLNPDPRKGLIVDLITEPASQLDYVWLPAMEAACKRFLEKFNEADWEGMYAGFEPALQKLVPPAKIKADLAPVLELMGRTGDPVLETYSLRDGGRNELQYAVPADNGQAVFRCGLHATENSMKILAYLVAPYPDTALYKSKLEDVALQQLPELMGAEISSVKIPYDQLTHFNDVADGVAELANGEQVKFRVTRSGRRDDFSQFDYTFAVFEAQKP